MKIGDIDPDRIVKIGSIHGQGFFYVGRLLEMNNLQIDRELKEESRRDFENAFRLLKSKEADNVDQKLITKFTKAWEGYSKFKPIMEREIYDTWESIAEPGVLTIIVEGGGKGSHWMVDESRPIELRSDKGALDLLGAVYKSLCDDLEGHYKDIYKYRNSEMQTRAAKMALYLESQCTPGVSRMTRVNAVKAICYDTKGKQIHDPKEVEEIILTALGRGHGRKDNDN